MTDTQAMDAITKILDKADQWSWDTVDEVYQVVKLTGRDIRPVPL